MSERKHKDSSFFIFIRTRNCIIVKKYLFQPSHSPDTLCAVIFINVFIGEKQVPGIELIIHGTV